MLCSLDGMEIYYYKAMVKFKEKDFGIKERALVKARGALRGLVSGADQAMTQVNQAGLKVGDSILSTLGHPTNPIAQRSFRPQRIPSRTIREVTSDIVRNPVTKAIEEGHHLITGSRASEVVQNVGQGIRNQAEILAGVPTTANRRVVRVPRAKSRKVAEEVVQKGKEGAKMAYENTGEVADNVIHYVAQHPVSGVAQAASFHPFFVLQHPELMVGKAGIAAEMYLQRPVETASLLNKLVRRPYQSATKKAGEMYAGSGFSRDIRQRSIKKGFQNMTQSPLMTSTGFIPATI